MPFSGAEVSEKGFPRGWDADAEDLASQRVFRVTQLLEAMVFRPFSWNIFASMGLEYAFHGGLIDNGVDEWVLIGDGIVELMDGETNFIERSDAGNVVVNQTGFTYIGFIPMAEIETRNGTFIATTYIDRRPEIGGAPAGGSGATITFPQIIGLILNSQVPVGAVKQHEAALCIRALQVTPGTFGAGSCAALGDYTFGRDLDILQDLFVGRDAIINEDLQVIETMMVGGTFTAESLAFFLGAAVFSALATFEAAVVMESTLNVQGLATFEAQALFQALATFQAAAVFESTVNIEGVTTLEDQVRRGIRTITAADTPYTLIETDWHLNVDISLGSVEVLIPDAAAHFSAGFTDQLHFKIIGSGFGEPFVTLTPSVPGQLIDTFEEAILRRNNLSFTLVTDGTGWWIQ
jgi:hypothetical protein